MYISYYRPQIPFIIFFGLIQVPLIVDNVGILNKIFNTRWQIYRIYTPIFLDQAAKSTWNWKFLKNRIKNSLA